MAALSRRLQHPRTAATARVAAVAFAVVSTLSVAALHPAFAADEIVRAPSGIEYVTGGAGTEAVDRLKSMERDFTLKLVFANTTGEYLSDVRVTIADASGHVMLATTSQGPLLMAKLAPGSYRVDATFNGRPESRNVTVAGSKLMTLDFRWAAS
jgi:hypothetical protein